MTARKGRPSAEQAQANSVASRTHGTGRVCASKKCTTILSIYNETDRCAIHLRSDPEAVKPKVMVRGRAAGRTA